MINGKRVLAVTLARGGSKAIPQKNIAPIHGRPLLEYTLLEVQKSKFIDSYRVSTDCPEIRQVCQNAGVEVVDRPASLATATAKSSDALLHAVEQLPPHDYVVEVMATNPLKTADDIDACIEKLDHSGVDSVVSVVRIFDHHPARVKYIENDVLMDFYPEVTESRRQDLQPAAYVRNGSIYAMTRNFLLRERVRYNKQTRPYIMPASRTVNIDEPQDLVLAAVLLSRRCGEDTLPDASSAYI